MSKILGLDLGVSSIGWSVVALDDEQKPSEILGMGSRIIPLDKDSSEEFTKGKAISLNQARTARRTARKMLDRYQQRREKLKRLLKDFGMSPTEELISLSPLELWYLRADAAVEGKQLELMEIGRILYHMVQKRGYKHAKGDADSEGAGNSRTKKQDTEYVSAVKSRYAELQESGKTIGQHFALKLKESALGEDDKACTTYRIKDQVYPREAYVEEFDRIMAVQSAFYPEVLTPGRIQELKMCIFYQRPLKSCKHLVSFCEFERRYRISTVKQIDRNGHEILVEKRIDIGPKVAPKSSPLAEVCRLWEIINNIRLKDDKGLFSRELDLDTKRLLFDYLQTNDVLNVTKAKTILRIRSKEDINIALPIDGNRTSRRLRTALKDYPQYQHLLRFDLKTCDSTVVDASTGEVQQVISESYLQEPLYKFWHILYSIEGVESMAKALEGQLGISVDDLQGGLLDKLRGIDFTKDGYSNKSAKFMCKLLPHLQMGMGYSEASVRSGIRHSHWQDKHEVESRPLLDTIPILPRNSLRQPVVEKVLNQMINLVNALKAEYGDIDAVRIELARELKMSRDERQDAIKSNGSNKKRNDEIAERIKEYNLYPTRSRIQKYKMWDEAKHCCMYCGATIGIADFLSGSDVEVEHIIPRSILCDDSFTNKTCACRACNQAKGNRTGLEYARSKGEPFLTNYLKRIEDCFPYKRKANQRFTRRPAKYDRLMMEKTFDGRLMLHGKEVPEDFIERHLRLTQYIARKAQEVLEQGIRHVYASEGSVTSKLRHLWGYDTILESLNLSRYQSMGETELVNTNAGQREVIKGWEKRRDHRHHALDALVVACTEQAYIQRLNRINSQADRDEMARDLEGFTQPREDGHRLLDRWLAKRYPFSTDVVKQKMIGILISFPKPKAAYTKGKNAYLKHGKRVVQSGLIVPRGPLSKETVMGRIMVGDASEFVVKYNLVSLKKEDLRYVVDKGIRRLIENRLEQCGNDSAKAFAEPLYSDSEKTQQIRSVRCFTKNKEESMLSLRSNERGEPVGYAMSGKNHHLAIYRDTQGKLYEHVVPFWAAIERARYGLPIIVTDPKATIDQALAIDALPERLLAGLPQAEWAFHESLQINEMFLVGMSDEEIEEAMTANDVSRLSCYLYRGQKFSSGRYFFRYHLETALEDSGKNAEIPRYHQLSLSRYQELNVRKVYVDVLGRITLAR